MTPVQALGCFETAFEVESDALEAYRLARGDERDALLVIAKPNVSEAERRSARYALTAARGRCEETRRRLALQPLHDAVERAADDVLAMAR